jgi:ferredoxin
MKVRVDSTVCQGHARCITIAPEYFGFNDAIGIAVASERSVTPADASDVEEAVWECPTRAITIVDDDPGDVRCDAGPQ